jgi:uncharacterized lipoprotein YbaY
MERSAGPGGPRIVAALLLAACLAGCATDPVEPPKPAPLEAPINSLALEQCLKVNGPEACAG